MLQQIIQDASSGMPHTRNKGSGTKKNKKKQQQQPSYIGPSETFATRGMSNKQSTSYVWIFQYFQLFDSPFLARICRRYLTRILSIVYWVV